MSLVSYIVIALAFGICNMLLFRRCAEATPVRLSAGLGISLLVAAVQAILMWLGAQLGNILRFELADDPHAFHRANCWVFVVFALFVSVRTLFPYLRRELHLPLFSLDSVGRVVLMAFATGIDVLLVGIGSGFADETPAFGRVFWPMVIICILFGYLGVMFGRQKVAVRPRRWAIVAALMVLGVAVASLFSA